MKKQFIFSAILIVFNALTFISKAQMIGADVFLQGRYVEVGIGSLGYFGSGGVPPTGYHGHCTSCLPANSLGFVADPGMDGWAVGTPPMMGDYFVPGSPFEGWELQVGGKRCQGYNSGTSSAFVYGGGMSTCTGSNISYSTSGGVTVGVWEGTIDSIRLTQITTLDTNSLYFTVKIILTNLSSAPKDSIYYMRSVDADNDQTWPGGSFVTNNMVEYQSTDTTIVSATGTSVSAPYLAFGTTDTAATALVYNAWGLSIAQDLASGYAGNTSFGGTSYYTPGINHPGDIAIGLIMSIPHLASVDSAGDSVYRTTAVHALHPANSASFSYFFAFSQGGRDSAIAFLNRVPPPPPSTLSVTNVNEKADIKVYPNPSKDQISITGLTSTDHVALYDMMGRSADQNWAVTHDGTSTFRYSNVPVGSYVVVITDAGGNIKSRVLVRKN